MISRVLIEAYDLSKRDGKERHEMGTDPVHFEYKHNISNILIYMYFDTENKISEHR